MTTGAGVPLRFWLVRTNDVRDGSTWIVAEGTQFSDGLLVVSTPGVGTVCSNYLTGRAVPRSWRPSRPPTAGGTSAKRR
jgi:hypothetical protein